MGRIDAARDTLKLSLQVGELFVVTEGDYSGEAVAHCHAAQVALWDNDPASADSLMSRVWHLLDGTRSNRLLKPNYLSNLLAKCKKPVDKVKGTPVSRQPFERGYQWRGLHSENRLRTVYARQGPDEGA